MNTLLTHQKKPHESRFIANEGDRQEIIKLARDILQINSQWMEKEENKLQMCVNKGLKAEAVDLTIFCHVRQKSARHTPAP